MHLFIDNREPIELIKAIQAAGSLINDNKITFFVKKLEVGDFVLYDETRQTDLIIIERKSLSDLEASVKDGRYNEQSYRLSQLDIPNHNIYYLLEGNMSTYRNSKLIASCLTSLSFFKGFSVLNTLNMSGTAKLIVDIVSKITKEYDKVPYYVSDKLRNYENNKIINVNTSNEQNNDLVDETVNIETNTQINIQTQNNDNEYCHVLKASKKSNVTRDNIGSIMLMQIPGVSNQTSIAIMKEYVNVSNLIKNIETNPNCLDNIKLESNRKISKSAINSIKEYLL